MPVSRQVVVVGCGRVGRLLVADLPVEWRVTAIDPNIEKLAQLPREHAGLSIRKIQGDATSRLVLEQCKLDQHTLFVVVTGSDTVNREVARLARHHFGVEEVVVLIDELRGIDQVGLKQCEVVQRHRATAHLVLNRLLGTEQRAVSLGLGQGEIRMVTVLQGSGLAGRPLSETKPHHWLVAAVYRDDRLIVPHGDTVLQADDRVLVVGDLEVIESVASLVRGGEPLFPNQYGPKLGLLGGETARLEAAWLAGHVRATRVVTVEPTTVDVGTLGPAGVADALEEQGIGCLVVDARRESLLSRIGFYQSRRRDLLLASRVPVLVARGTFPYRRVLLAVGTPERANAIGSVAIDVARQCEAALTVLTVTPPAVSVGVEEQRPLRDLPRRVAQVARLHGIEAERALDVGNPIERIRSHAKAADLLIIGHSPRKRSTLLTPDVSMFLVHDAPCSVLVVPWNLSGR